MSSKFEMFTWHIELMFILVKWDDCHLTFSEQICQNMLIADLITAGKWQTSPVKEKKTQMRYARFMLSNDDALGRCILETRKNNII